MLEEVHVRPHLEKGLVDSDKASNMQYLCWVEVLQLQAPLVEEPVQEPVRGIPEPALVEGEEAYDLIGPRVRNNLPWRRSPPMHHFLRREQPLLDEGGQHCLVYVGWPSV